MLKLKKSHFAMAKRSKIHNKEQPGCMSGLIGIFDFRHGRITRRMLSDQRYATKNTTDPASPSPEVDLRTSSEEIHLSIENESETQTFDHIIKPSVKELMEEEMFIEVEKSFDSECGSHENTHKLSEKPSMESLNNHEISIDKQNSSQKTSQYHDLEALMKELLTMQNKAFSEEKINLAVEAFLSEKTHHSKDDLIDKEQFLKLFQDHNLLLLSEEVKVNEDEKSKSIARSNSFENGQRDRKNRNFFRRRSKSQEDVSLKCNDSPGRIVILKPENRIKKENEVQNSHFSFMEIKKKIKNAIVKDQSKSKKMNLDGSNAWSSPNRDHFYTEKYASFSNGFKREENISKFQEEPEKKVMENDENEDKIHRISNIYIEAKKHLSEMLKNEDEDEELSKRTLSKSLGKLLSLPEYNSLSPCGNFRMVNESQPCEINDPEVKIEVSKDVDDLVEDDRSFVREDMSFEGVVEIVKSPSSDVEYQEETDISKSINDDDKHAESFEVFEEERSPQLFKSDLIEEIEFSSPTTSPMGSQFAKKTTEEFESAISDATERPSPVSVLEPLFSDNDISPASTLSRQTEIAIRPLRIRFEEICSPTEDHDQEISIRNCTENEESAFEYVEAVLLASDLNWNDFEKRWLSSLQILDPFLFNEVEIFSSRPHHDQQLLFDSTNETLKEVCDSYLGSFFDLSTIKRNVQTIPKRIDLVNEVWEKIEKNIYSIRPRFLDRLVKNDLAISKMWMDLRCDTREMVFEVEESMFEDIMNDAVSSLVNDCADKNEEISV